MPAHRLSLTLYGQNCYKNCENNHFVKITQVNLCGLLVSTPREDPVHVVIAGPQVTSRSNAGVNLGLTDVTCRHARWICTVCFAIWRPRRWVARCAVYSPTNQQPGFFCNCTTDMEQTADRALAAVADHYFSSPNKNIPFQSAYGHRETNWWLFCDASIPQFPSRAHNTNDSVTLT